MAGRYDRVAAQAAHIDMIGQVAAVPDRGAFRHLEIDVHAARGCAHGKAGRQRAADLLFEIGL
jgi:hypothetical protein